MSSSATSGPDALKRNGEQPDDGQRRESRPEVVVVILGRQNESAAVNFIVGTYWPAMSTDVRNVSSGHIKYRKINVAIYRSLGGFVLSRSTVNQKGSLLWGCFRACPWLREKWRNWIPLFCWQIS